MLRRYNKKRGLSKKLLPKFDGPYYITKVGPKHTFNLRRQSNHKPVKSRVHANRLKPYFNPALRRYTRIVEQQRQPLQQPNHPQENQTNIKHQVDDQTNRAPDAPQNVEQIPDETETHNEPNYFVEKILASTNYKGEKIYKVKWLVLKNTTWERKSSLPENLINDFHIHHNAQGRKRKRPLKYFKHQN